MEEYKKYIYLDPSLTFLWLIYSKSESLKEAKSIGWPLDFHSKGLYAYVFLSQSRSFIFADPKHLTKVKVILFADFFF
jgi:hypothetical protein